MATALEDLRVLRVAEEVADAIWKQVVEWDDFARDVVGKQMARAADSIGANIAESYGRYHYGEKLRFLYYSRGSLFETKYWLNRALARHLISAQTVQSYAGQLSKLAHQLNLFAGSIKRQRAGIQRPSDQIRETTAEYMIRSDSSSEPFLFNDIHPLFSEDEISFIAHPPKNKDE